MAHSAEDLHHPQCTPEMVWAVLPNSNTLNQALFWLSPSFYRMSLNSMGALLWAPSLPVFDRTRTEGVKWRLEVDSVLSSCALCPPRNTDFMDAQGTAAVCTGSFVCLSSEAASSGD